MQKEASCKLPGRQETLIVAQIKPTRKNVTCKHHWLTGMHKASTKLRKNDADKSKNLSGAVKADSQREMKIAEEMEVKALDT